MILKLSDLQRSLDISLATTHGPNRIYLIVGQYCAQASMSDMATPRCSSRPFADHQSSSRNAKTFTRNFATAAFHGAC